MPDIYDQHRAAFAKVSAFVVLKDGERVATVAFKHPQDGAGRLYAYVHYFGTAMVRGFASGGGYDKCSAACNAAARKIKPGTTPDTLQIDKGPFVAALLADDGAYWHQHLERAGFKVLQAV